MVHLVGSTQRVENAQRPSGAWAAWGVAKTEEQKRKT
jgi:hypothetical protein